MRSWFIKRSLAHSDISFSSHRAANLCHTLGRSSTVFTQPYNRTSYYLPRWQRNWCRFGSNIYTWVVTHWMISHTITIEQNLPYQTIYQYWTLFWIRSTMNVMTVLGRDQLIFCELIFATINVRIFRILTWIIHRALLDSIGITLAEKNPGK